MPSLGRGHDTVPARGILQPLLTASCRARYVQEGGEQNSTALVPWSLRSSRREEEGNCGVRGMLDKGPITSLGMRSLSLDTRVSVRSRGDRKQGRCQGPRLGQLVGA